MSNNFQVLQSYVCNVTSVTERLAMALQSNSGDMTNYFDRSSGGGEKVGKYEKRIREATMVAVMPIIGMYAYSTRLYSY